MPKIFVIHSGGIMEENKRFFEKIGEIFKKTWEFVKSKKLLFIIIAAVLVVAIVATTVFFAFGKKDDVTDSEFDRPQGNTLYTVNVKTVGGMAMSGLDVYIYTDDSLSDMIDYTKTNEDGKATFNLDESADYAIVLTSVPRDMQLKKVINSTAQVRKLFLHLRLLLMLIFLLQHWALAT